MLHMYCRLTTESKEIRQCCHNCRRMWLAFLLFGTKLQHCDDLLGVRPLLPHLCC